MAVTIEKAAKGKILLVHATGKLTKNDYADFAPEVERLVREHGKVRILFDMVDFHGWTASALWEDVKFDLKHFAHIERLALIGERSWEHGMAWFCKPFTRAKIRYFGHHDSEAAREWLENGLPVTSETTSAAR